MDTGNKSSNFSEYTQKQHRKDTQEIKQLILEVHTELKGNPEFANDGLSYIVRVDHENRLNELENKAIYLVAIGVAVGVFGSVLSFIVMTFVQVLF